MIALVVAAALAGEPAPQAWVWPEVQGIELLIIQPVAARVLGFQRRPEVPLPAPIEGSLGHVALRLVDDGPIAGQWTVGVSAFMDVDGDGADDPSNVWRGLTGGYDKRVLIQPLTVLASEYARNEARWIRRYAIPMSAAEVEALAEALLAAHATGEARELGGYVFFTENCATEITELLNTVLLGRPRELNYPYTIAKKYRRRGVVTPEIRTVTPADADAPLDASWAIPPSLVRRCAEGDAPCATAWVATATQAFGAAWVAEMADLAKRRAYRERWSTELRAELARVHDAE